MEEIEDKKRRSSRMLKNKNQSCWKWNGFKTLYMVLYKYIVVMWLIKKRSFVLFKYSCRAFGVTPPPW